MSNRRHAKPVYAIFRLDNPNIPDIDILHQCLERLRVGVVGIVKNPQCLDGWGAEHTDELILEVYSSDMSGDGIMAAAAAYIKHQTENWRDDKSMSAWFQYDQWTRLKNFRHMD